MSGSRGAVGYDLATPWHIPHSPWIVPRPLHCRALGLELRVARPLGDAEAHEPFAGDGRCILRHVILGVRPDDHHVDHSPRDGDTFVPVCLVLALRPYVGAGVLVGVQPNCAGWRPVTQTDGGVLLIVVLRRVPFHAESADVRAGPLGVCYLPPLGCHVPFPRNVP